MSVSNRRTGFAFVSLLFYIPHLSATESSAVRLHTTTSFSTIPTSSSTPDLTPFPSRAMAFRHDGSHMDDRVAASLYICHPIADADLTVYSAPEQALFDGGDDLDWLDGFCRAAFNRIPHSVSKLNGLIAMHERDQTRAERGVSRTSHKSTPRSAMPSGLAAGGTADHAPAPTGISSALPSPRSPTTAVGATPGSPGKPTPTIKKQKLPKKLKKVDDLIEAWTKGIHGLQPMYTFVGNKSKNEDMKLDRLERKQLSGHRVVVRKILGEDGQAGIGRERFRQEYEIDSNGATRSLRAIREMIEKEGACK